MWLDATYVDLCLKVFPWARYRKTKGALKLHVGLDHEGCLPSFLHVTDGKGSDLEVARSLRLPKGSIVAADRLYLDFGWLKDLDAQGVFLVTRLKRKVKYAVRERRSFARGRGVTSDQTIVLTSVKGRKRCPIPLRRVGYRDPETGRHYKFLTNNFSLAPKTIADIYKARWQIELFFKWIKQNLRIKSFVGTSRNAVMTQNLDRHLRPSAARIPEIRQQDVLEHEPDPAPPATQPVRPKTAAGTARTSERTPRTEKRTNSTCSTLKFVGQQCYPCECVVAVGEVKSVVDRAALRDAFEKVGSVKKLRRNIVREAVPDPNTGEGWPIYRSYGGLHDTLHNGGLRDASRPPGELGEIFGFVLAGESRLREETLATTFLELTRTTGDALAPNLLVTLDGVSLSWGSVTDEQPGRVVRQDGTYVLSIPRGGPPRWKPTLSAQTAEFLGIQRGDGFRLLVRRIRDIHYRGRTSAISSLDRYFRSRDRRSAGVRPLPKDASADAQALR